MADLNSRAEEAKRQGYVAGRETSRAESASKPKAMQESKGKGDEPRLALSQSLGIFALSENFVRNKKNAKSDDSFDGSGRDVNEAERSQSQGNRVRKSEGADGEE